MDDRGGGGVVRGLWVARAAPTGTAPGGAAAAGAAAYRHARSTAGSNCALSGPASRADVDERDESLESDRACRVVEVQCEPEGHRASGRSSESGIRREFRCVGPLSPG